jgi:hypothetical protein
MNLKYKIIEVYPEQHSIVVRFYTDVITEGMLAVDVLDGVIRRGRTDFNIDLPFPAPTGDALAELIVSKAPSDWLATQEAILNPVLDTSLSNVAGLVGQELTPPTPAVQAVQVTTNAVLDTGNTLPNIPVSTL